MDAEDRAGVDRHKALDGLALRLGWLVWPKCPLVQAAEGKSHCKVAEKLNNGVVSIEKHRAYNQVAHVVEPIGIYISVNTTKKGLSHRNV